MLSGREYHSQPSVVNPYSNTFQLFTTFHSNDIFSLLYAGDGHYRFTVTLGISLTMPNKKYFLNLLLLKIFTGP